MICAQKHDTKGHFCAICHTKEQCIHLPILCANCGLPHKANDKKCIEWEKVNPKNHKSAKTDYMELKE